jgi:hypothetical protein
MDNFSRDDRLVGGLAILLAICLLFFPWFDITVNVGAFSASATFTATGDPDGWLGILAVIACLALIADLLVEKFSPQTTLPTIGGTRPDTRFILAVVAAGFVALKFLFHIHFSLFGWGFYISVIVTAALVFFAAQARSAAPAMMSHSMAGSAPSPPPTAAPSRPRSAAPPPPPPSEPAATASEPPVSTGGPSGGPEPAERGPASPPGTP